MNPTTQVVIAVHSPQRPLRRAIDSVLADEESAVIVVAHNVAPRLLDIPDDGRVTVIEHTGEKGMPGAPRNTGLAAATSEWVSFLDSDDYFQPNALAAMRKRGQQTDSPYVIAPFFKVGKRTKSWLPTHRTHGLRPQSDGLFYRTAPFGLFRRAALDGMVYREDVRTGEDIRVSTDLWTRKRGICHFWKDPAYVVEADQSDRISMTPMDLRESGQGWHELWDEPFVKNWSNAVRHAYAVKVARIHVTDAVAARPSEEMWNEGEFDWLVEATRRLMAEDHHADRPLPRDQSDLIRAICAGDLDEALELNQRGWSDQGPRRAFDQVLEAESPLRWRIKNYVANKRRAKSA